MLRRLIYAIFLSFVYVCISGWFIFWPGSIFSSGDSNAVKDLVTKRDWPGLLELTDKRLEVDEKNDRWWLLKGYALMQMGQHAKSIEASGTATKLNPSNDSAWQNIGASSLALRKYSDAISAFERARELKPQNGRPVYGLAVTYYESGDKAKGLDNYERLKGMDTGLAEAFANRFLRQAQKDPREKPAPDATPPQSASVSLQKTEEVQDTPGSSSETRSTASSITSLQERVAKEPTNPDAWYALGIAYKSDKDYERARQCPAAC